MKQAYVKHLKELFSEIHKNNRLESLLIKNSSSEGLKDVECSVLKNNINNSLIVKFLFSQHVARNSEAIKSHFTVLNFKDYGNSEYIRNFDTNTIAERNELAHLIFTIFSIIFKAGPEDKYEIIENTSNGLIIVNSKQKVTESNTEPGGDFLTYIVIFFFLLIGVYMIYDLVSERLKTADRKTISAFTPEQYDSIRIQRAIQDSLADIRRAERISARQKQKDEADEEIRRYVKAIHDSYNELMSFKNNQRFHQFGFGRGGPYHQWLLNAQRLRNNPLHRELYDRYGFGVLSLEQLGQEYVKTRGMENDFTRTLRERFSRLSHDSSIY